MPRGAVVQGILFDLDGTLLDTAADIAAALNAALQSQQLGTCTVQQVRDMIGRGVPTLIERALKRLGATADRAVLEERYHAYYTQRHERGEDEARIYPGVVAGLAALHARGFKLAVVTNKPKDAAIALLSELRLKQWIAAVVGGDSCAHRKPHPQPLLTACELLGVTPGQTLMVGDSATDVQAARAAGVRVVCVPYGYNEGADPRQLPCDGIVEQLTDLPALLSA
jgi:phosphoglycolate phosphatase